MIETPDDALEVIEQSPNRFSFKRTINMAFFRNVLNRMIKIYIVAMLFVGIVVLASLALLALLLSFYVLLVLPYFMAYVISLIIVWISSSAYFRDKTRLFVSIVLDQASSRCQIMYWMVDARERTSTRVLFQRPLHVASNLEIVAANDLRGFYYGGVKEYFKDKYVLKTRDFTTRFPIYPGFIYSDADFNKIQALKSMIDNCTSNSRTEPFYK